MPRLNHFLVEKKKTHVWLVSSIDVFLGSCSMTMIVHFSQDGLQSFIPGYRVLTGIVYIISNLHIRPNVGERI